MKLMMYIKYGKWKMKLHNIIFAKMNKLLSIRIIWLLAFISGCIISYKVNQFLGCSITFICGLNYKLLLGDGK